MEPRGLQTETGPKAQVENEPTDDGVSRMSAEGVSPLQEKEVNSLRISQPSWYRKVISLPSPSMTVASLHTVGHGCRVPLLKKHAHL